MWRVWWMAGMPALGAALVAADPRSGMPSGLPAGTGTTTAVRPRVVALMDAPARAAPVEAAPIPPTPRWTQRQVLDALRIVESSRAKRPRDGDDGHALGPPNARRHARHEDCRDAAYAESVVRSFMDRYAGAAWTACDAETIARIHNGGPAGPHHASTDAYWSRVEAVLRVTPSR